MGYFEAHIDMCNERTLIRVPKSIFHASSTCFVAYNKCMFGGGDVGGMCVCLTCNRRSLMIPLNWYHLFITLFSDVGP